MTGILICGIDEAGRGALIGPMTIAGVCIDKKLESKMKVLGVKDSKELSPARRRELYQHIEDMTMERGGDVVIFKVPACKIESYKRMGINLDRVEAMRMADIIKALDADVFYIDSLRSDASKFKKMIMEYLPADKRKAKLVVENHMDESVTVVGAASIMAKVERDKSVEEIKEAVGFDVGVGYSHDQRTIKFLEKILQEHESPPEYLRTHWDTVETTARRLLDEDKKVKSWVMEKVLRQSSLQGRLRDFFFKKNVEC